MAEAYRRCADADPAKEPETAKGLAFYVSKRFAEFVLSVSMFTQHRIAYLTREYGRTGAEVEAFKKANSAAFDTFDRYALVCALRNAIFHAANAGQPRWQSRLGADGKTVERTFSFFVDRDELLQDQKIGPAARTAILSLPSEIPIMDAAQTAMTVVEGLLLQSLIALQPNVKAAWDVVSIAIELCECTSGPEPCTPIVGEFPSATDIAAGRFALPHQSLDPRYGELVERALENEFVLTSPFGELFVLRAESAAPAQAESA